MNSKTPWTPGPWVAARWVTDTSPHPWAVEWAAATHGHYDEPSVVAKVDSEPNARLIAAAPELVEALRVLTVAANALLVHAESHGFLGQLLREQKATWNYLNEGTEQARALLAKLEGEKA